MTKSNGGQLSFDLPANCVKEAAHTNKIALGREVVHSAHLATVPHLHSPTAVYEKNKLNVSVK